MRKSVFSVNLVLCLIMVTLVGCQLQPATQKSTDMETASTVAVTQSAQSDFPPLIQSVYPIENATISTNQEFIFEFTQPMDAASVEASLIISPRISGAFTWLDEQRLKFVPDQQLIVNQDIRFIFTEEAQNQTGIGLHKQWSFDFNVAPALKMTSTYPSFREKDIDSQTDAFYVSFNLPVIEESVPENERPSGFLVEPELSGRGEWISNSTYAFYPEQGLVSGADYTLTVNRQLKSVFGTILEVDQSMEWSFQTSEPEVISVLPSNAIEIPLDQAFVVSFSQPMSTESVAVNFRFHDIAGELVIGRFLWNDDATEMTFIPENPLDRGRVYILEILPGSTAKGGGVLNDSVLTSFSTIKQLEILSTTPANGQPIDLVIENKAILVNFSTKLNERNDYENLIKVFPEVEDLEIVYIDDKLQLQLSGKFNPGETYQVLISAAIKDEWNGVLGKDYLFEFQVSPPQPNIFVPNMFDGHTLVIPSGLFSVAVQEVNLPIVQTKLYKIEFDEYIKLLENAELSIDANPIEFFQQPLSPVFNQLVQAELLLNLDETPLEPGIYAVELFGEFLETKRFFIVVNETVVISKESERQLFISAFDLENFSVKANEPITVKDNNGSILYQGLTDENGVLIFDEYFIGNGSSELWVEVGGIANEASGLFNLAWVLDKQNETQFDVSDTGLFWQLNTEILVAKETLTGFGFINTNKTAIIPNQIELMISSFDDPEAILTIETVDVEQNGAFIFEAVLPDNFREGVYNVSIKNFEGSTKQFRITDHLQASLLTLDVEFSKAQYTADSIVKAEITYAGNSAVILNDKNISWELIIANSKTGMNEVVSATSGLLLDEGEAVLSKNSSVTVEYDLKEFWAENKSDSSLRLILIAKILDDIGQTLTEIGEAVVYPNHQQIEIDVDRIYDSPEEIVIGLSTRDWADNPVGALDFEFYFQKYIPAVDGSGESYIWSDLNHTSGKTDGNGQARLPIYPNTPGIYRVLTQIENFEVEEWIFIGGKGYSEFSLLPNGSVPIGVDEGGDNGAPRIFIPNPFVEPVMVLLTLEKEKVHYHEVFKLRSGQRIVELDEESLPPGDYRVSVILISESTDEMLYGQTEIQIEDEQSDIDLEVKLTEDDVSEIAFTIKGFEDTQSNNVILLQVIEKGDSDYLSFFAEIAKQFTISNDLISTSGLFGEIYQENAVGYLRVANSVVQSGVISNSYDISWQSFVTIDEDGYGDILIDDIPINPIEEKLLAVYLSPKNEFVFQEIEIPVRDALLTMINSPAKVLAGDHFTVDSTIKNLLDYPQSIQAEITLNGLTSDDPYIVERDIPAGETEKISWGINTDHEGEFMIDVKVIDPSLREYVNSQEIIVKGMPTEHQVIELGKLSDEINYKIPVYSEESNFGDQAFSIAFAPYLSSMLIPGVKNLEKSDIYENEMVALNLLTYLEMINFDSDVSLETVNDLSINEQINQGIQILLKRQNADGGWGYSRDVYSSNMQSTLTATWALKVCEMMDFEVAETALIKARDYVLLGLVEAGPGNSTLINDLAAWQHYVLALMQVDNIDPLNLLPNIDSFSPAGQAFVSLAINEAWPGDQRSRLILNNLAAQTINEGELVYWANYDKTIRLFANNQQSTAFIAAVFSKLDPANEIMPNVIETVYHNQSAQWVWENVFTQNLSLIALAAYANGYGQVISEYTASAYVDGVETIKIEPPYDFVQSVVEAAYLSDTDNQNEHEIELSRNEEEGDLFYIVSSAYEPDNESLVITQNGINIERFFVVDDQNVECMERDFCLQSDVPEMIIDKPISVLIKISVFEPVSNIAIKESIPYGMAILDGDYLGRESLATPIQPLLTVSDAAFDFEITQANGIIFYAESLSAGTYYQMYTLLPSYAGKYFWQPIRVDSLDNATLSANYLGYPVEIK